MKKNIFRDMVLGAILSGIFLLAFSNTAFSEWTLGTATNTLVCSHDSDKGYHTVLHDGNGGFFVVWFDCRNCGDTYKDVYAQHYNAQGEPQWTENGLQVCSMDGGDKKPYADLDGQGGIVVAWTNDDSNGGVQRINANGNLMWPEQKVMEGEYASRCASDGAGGIIIVSCDHIQRVNAAGVPLWGPDPGDPEGGLIYSSTVYCGYRVIDDGSQGAIVVWYDDSDNIAANRIDSAGNLMWGDADNPVFLNNTGDSRCPRIIAAGSGYYIITWTDSSITDNRIYAQKINLSGVIQWAAGGILVTGQESKDDYGLVTDGNGGGYVTWSNAADSNMYAQRIFSDGTLWAEPLQLTTSGDVDDTAGKGFGMVHAIASGGFVTTWENDSGEIVAQRVTLSDDGTPVLGGGVDGIVVSLTSSGWLTCPRIAADNNGNALVVWRDDGNDEDIYAQKIIVVEEEDIEGDIDGDGDVDVNDLNLLISSLNQPLNTCSACDINDDGVITVLDVRELITINPLLARDRRLRTLLRTPTTRTRR